MPCLKFAFFALLLSLSSLIHAKGYSPAVTARPGGYSVGFSSNGTPIAVPATGGAAARVEAQVPFTFPNGAPGAAEAAAIFTGARTAGAWGAAAAAAGIGAMWAIEPIKRWMETAAVGFRPDTGEVTALPVDGCYSAPCYGYAGRVDASNPTGIYGSFSAACASRGIGRSSASQTTVVSSVGYPNCRTVTTYLNPIYAEYNSDEVTNVGGRVDVAVTPSNAGTPISIADAQARLAQQSPSAAVVQALVDLNFPPVAEIPVLTGAASAFKGNVVSLGLDGSVKEIEERYVASFSPGVINIGVQKKETVTAPGKQSTTTTTNADGSQSTAVTTTPGFTRTLTATVADSTAEPSKVEVCGLPGTPACKIDETGTPTVLADGGYNSRLEQVRTDGLAEIPKVGGTADKSFLDGWGSLFSTPALVACEPMELPRSIGSINPCPVVDGVRAVMALLWAAGGLFLCLGMVREVL